MQTPTPAPRMLFLEAGRLACCGTPLPACRKQPQDSILSPAPGNPALLTAPSILQQIWVSLPTSSLKCGFPLELLAETEPCPVQAAFCQEIPLQDQVEAAIHWL